MVVLEMPQIAARLAADLMPIGVVTAGDQADELAAALSAHGAGADMFSADTGDGYDLAVLRVHPLVLENPEARANVEKLAAISQRLLFWPQSEDGEGYTSNDLTPWFELLGELGFQPVVEYDAAYIAQGAFLVDRAATAAEAELEIFMQRLSLGSALAATEEKVEALQVEQQQAQAVLKARLDDIAACMAQLAAAETRITLLEQELAAQRAERGEEQAVMARLAEWIRAACHMPDNFVGPKLGFWAPRRDKRAARAADKLRAERGYDPVAAILAHPPLAQSGQDPARYLAVEGGKPG